MERDCTTVSDVEPCVRRAWAAAVSIKQLLRVRHSVESARVTFPHYGGGTSLRVDTSLTFDMSNKGAGPLFDCEPGFTCLG